MTQILFWKNVSPQKKKFIYTRQTEREVEKMMRGGVEILSVCFHFVGVLCIMYYVCMMYVYTKYDYSQLREVTRTN